MKTKKEIRRIQAAIEEAYNLENKSLLIMFRADGSFAGEVLPCNSGYSKSDRARNNDYLYCELSDKAKDIALNNFRSACIKINNKQQPFGRGKMYSHEFNWYDFDDFIN
jgi:hypothetical protein